MLSKNEWDPLKSVIVGRADYATIPFLDDSLRTVNYAHVDNVNLIPQGPYPQQVIDEANEDLQTLTEFLISLGVVVYRPNKNVIPEYYNYCPRDTVFIHENLILATPTPLLSRVNEYTSMEEALHMFGDITYALRPDPTKLYNKNCIGNPDILALNETEPAFDAANILRANDDIYYLVSNSGNEQGALFLQELMPNKKVHTIKGIYSYMHLDSTIAFLREGLMLLNPSRIKSVDQLPASLRNWDVIWCPEPVDIGHYPGYCNASTWINMNLFSVSPNLAVVEENQHNLRIELEKHKIECAMLPMRHARTLGGCFHCVTLDLVRGNY